MNELKKEQYLSMVYETLYGRKSVRQMITEFGSPKLILCIARIEAKKPDGSGTEIIERVVNTELHFSDQVVVSGLDKTFCIGVADGIEVKSVRHPRYNPMNMPTATKAEMKVANMKREHE